MLCAYFGLFCLIQSIPEHFSGTTGRISHLWIDTHMVIRLGEEAGVGGGAAKGEVPPPPLPRDVLHTIQLYGLAEDNLSIFPSKWA